MRTESPLLRTVMYTEPLLMCRGLDSCPHSVRVSDRRGGGMREASWKRRQAGFPPLVKGGKASQTRTGTWEGAEAWAVAPVRELRDNESEKRL